MSAADTWMPFYVGDYLSATGRLTTEQHGAYLLILLDYWKNGPPPNDDAVLAPLARMTPAAWRKAKPALIGFFEIADGKLIQKRIEAERERAADNVEKRSKAGKASAAARAKHGNKRSTHVPTHVEANGQQNGRPSPSPGSNEPVSSSNDDSPSDDGPSLRPEHVFEFYREVATAIGLPVPRDFTPERRALTRARIAQYSLEDFHTVFGKCRDSPFLRGERGRTPLTFDWLMQKRNFQKVLEGNYDR